MSRTILITTTVAGLLLTGCAGDNGQVGGSGLIEATESVVSSETAGRVIDHRFAEGMSVHAGDTLLVIDPSRIELELDAARAGIDVLEAQLSAAQTSVRQAKSAEEFAQTELSRAEQLLASGTGTSRTRDQAKQSHDQAALATETARAQVATLKAQLDKAHADLARLERQYLDHFPVTPVDGLILEKFVELGELLAPGKPIARIANLDTVTVKVYLTTEHFAEVKLGDPATVSVESAGMTYPGTVVWTSDEAEFTPKNVQTEQARADLVYGVKVSIPNPDRKLKIGLPVFVTLGE